MARKVTCQICKAKGDTDTFYKVTDDKGRSKYYCSQEEYESFQLEKEKRQRLIDYILIEVFNYEKGQTVNSILFKKLKELSSFYDVEVIHECFVEQKENIQYWIRTKQFTNEFNMICYVMKIIEGNINDTYKKWKFKKQQELKRENNSVDFDVLNQLDNNTTKKNTENGILSFLDEEDI
jgi:YHS domain-containing protein